MSARLTEEKVADMQTYASTRLDGVRQQGGAEYQLQSDLLALIADRAAILESERDLLAALEELLAWAKRPVFNTDAAELFEDARAAIANAHKPDAPTGAGGRGSERNRPDADRPAE